MTLIGVAGTGTDIGKTWVTAACVRALRVRGLEVTARKPAQSYAAGDTTDAEVLAGSPAVRAALSAEGDRGVAGQLERVAAAYGYLAIAVVNPGGQVVASSRASEVPAR